MMWVKLGEVRALDQVATETFAQDGDPDCWEWDELLVKLVGVLEILLL